MAVRRFLAITAVLSAACLDLAAQTTHSVKLSWTWSQGNSLPASGFNVKRATKSGGPYSTIATLFGTSILTYTDPPPQGTNRSGFEHRRRTGDDLTPGATYYYVITAFSGNSESAPSSEAKAVIPGSAPVKRAVISILNSNGLSLDALTPDRAGIFRSGSWLLGPDSSQAVSFGGQPGDIPITGDWNGSGTEKLGVYRPSDHTFLVDYYGNREFTQVYDFGEGGDPVVGDWNGDGKTKAGLYREGVWILDWNGDGVYKTFAFGGEPGDVPVAGDWTGSGESKIGIYRRGSWILDMTGSGDYDPAVAFTFGGVPEDVPVVGDWNGDGRTKVGVFRTSFWVLDANGNRQFDGTGQGQDLVFPFGGLAGDKPIAGKWGGQSWPQPPFSGGSPEPAESRQRAKLPAPQN
jgi:hypothetical protein